ncbi:hypothetical protein [Coralliovum pocilloporae]|uniref:hypothetical protein n=1 Tax=Coralliovum pocilloporae TaxID=3066369 RepID=UPI003306E1B0
MPISFQPLIPDLPFFAVLAGLAILALAQLGLSKGRNWHRPLAAVVLALLLSNPVWQNDKTEILPNTLLVVEDRSESQTLGDRADTTTKARDHILKQAERLPNITVQTVTVSPETLDGTPGSRILEALEKAAGEIPERRLAGAVIISDGRIHDTETLQENLTLNAPLHALVTGTDEEIDRRLTLVSAPKFGIVGEEQTIRFRLDQQGRGNALEETLRVTIKRDGKIINELPVRTGVDAEVKVEIPHRGKSLFELSVAPFPGELTDLNNQLIVPIEGIRENLRVLLVSGAPHPGERTWRNLLKSDASVDLVHFTILRPPDKQDGTPVNQLSLIAFPTRELFAEKINQFDLIIFDRYKRRGVLPLLYFDNIARYVREGGAILVAAGPEYAEFGSLNETILSTVLPVRPSGGILETPFKARTTDIGRKHPVSRSLPGDADSPSWSPWFRVVDSDPTSGDTIMKAADDRPLLILDRVEEGRIAVLLSDHVWLWQRGFQGGGPYLPLLRRVAHWLMKEPDLEEERLTAKQQGRTLQVERQSLKDDLPLLQVTHPDGTTTSHTLAEAGSGKWVTTLTGLKRGLHTLRNGDLTSTVIFGRGAELEYRNPLSTLEFLSPQSDKTGGVTRRLANGDSLALPSLSVMSHGRRNYFGSGWLGLLEATEEKVLEVRRVPIFAGWVGLLIAFSMLAWMWRREGR